LRPADARARQEQDQQRQRLDGMEPDEVRHPQIAVLRAPAGAD
jgi:hypothetical protein